MNKHVDFIFNGDDTLYSLLISKHEQDLAIHKLAHIKNSSEVDRKLIQPVYPAKVTTGTAENRDYLFNKALSEYNSKLREYNKHADEFEKEFAAAIGHFRNRLTANIQNDVEGITNLSLNTSSRVKYNELLQYMFETYGPTNLNDIEALKSRLRDATDAAGYDNLLSTHRHIQNQLKKIQQRNTDGTVKLVDGNPLTYEFTDTELRAILMSQLGRSNKVFEDLRLSYIKQPDTTYKQMIKDIQNLLKDASVNRRKQDTMMNSPVTRTTSVGSCATTYCYPSNDDTNLISYNSNSYFPENYSYDAGSANEVIRCANCQQLNHYVMHCKSRDCTKCGATFSTWQERHMHGLQAHSLRNHNPSNNNQRSHRRKIIIITEGRHIIIIITIIISPILVTIIITIIIIALTDIDPDLRIRTIMGEIIIIIVLIITIIITTVIGNLIVHRHLTLTIIIITITSNDVLHLTIAIIIITIIIITTIIVEIISFQTIIIIRQIMMDSERYEHFLQLKITVYHNEIATKPIASIMMNHTITIMILTMKLLLMEQQTTSII